MDTTKPVPVPTTYDSFMRGDPWEREEDRQDRAERQDPPPASGSLPEPPTSVPLL